MSIELKTVGWMDADGKITADRPTGVSYALCLRYEAEQVLSERCSRLARRGSPFSSKAETDLARIPSMLAQYRTEILARIAEDLTRIFGEVKVHQGYEPEASFRGSGFTIPFQGKPIFVGLTASGRFLSLRNGRRTSRISELIDLLSCNEDPKV